MNSRYVLTVLSSGVINGPVSAWSVYTRVVTQGAHANGPYSNKGEAMEKKRRAWAKQGFHLYYLPPYSPELNRIEIVWKHAKYFWRRFTGLKGTDLLGEVQNLMDGFGSRFTINFA